MNMIESLANWWQSCNGEHVFGVCYVIGVVALTVWCGIQDIRGYK